MNPGRPIRANSKSPMTTPKPIKILFYTHGLVDGGAERLWACLATAFKERGYDVIFAQDFEADENRANLHPEIPLHTLGRNHFTATRNLAKLLRRHQPDVALSAVGASNLKLLLAAKLTRSTTQPIITFHGEMEWKTGWLSYLSYLGLPLLSRMAARTIAVSEGLVETLISKWKAYPDRMVCLLNPVFFPKDAPVPSAGELAARDNIVLSVGRLVPEKDFITLLRAFAHMRHPDARLVILGKGPEQQRIEAEIRRLRLRDRVSMPGYAKEPWTIYASAKCFVSSSTSEPFGNVVVEAMAYGLPIVATACAGPHEILKHGQHGRIVGIGNHVQLARAIRSTLDAPGDPAERRARAEDFSFETRVPEYEAVIRDVLEDAAASAAQPPKFLFAIPQRQTDEEPAP